MPSATMPTFRAQSKSAVTRSKMRVAAAKRVSGDGRVLAAAGEPAAGIRRLSRRELVPRIKPSCRCEGDGRSES